MKFKIVIAFFSISWCGALNAHEFQDWKNLNKLFVEAVDQGDIESVKDLAGHGAGLASKNRFGYAPLHVAIFHEDVPLVLELLRLRSPVQTPDDSHKDTPLHIAAAMGNMKAIDALIQAGADVNALNRENQSPLHQAAAYGYPRATRILLDAGADSTLRDCRGNAALEYAQEGNYRKIVKLIKQAQRVAQEKSRNNEGPSSTEKNEL